MANEFRTRHLTGKTLYAVLVRATDGQVYNGSSFEAPLAANWGAYAVTLAEQSTTGLYYGTMPAVAAGIYDVLFFWRSGGSPAATDALVGQGSLDWGGSVELGLNRALDSSYRVRVDLTAAVPTSNTANTVGDCLNAARAQGFGEWVLAGTTLTLYAPDGTTAVRTFTLDDANAPTRRT